MFKTPTLKFLAFIVSLFVCNWNSFGQPVDSKQRIDSIKWKVVEYLVDQNVLETHEELEDYEKRFSIIELLDKNVLGYKSNGIYKIWVHTSHTKQYLMIKSYAECKILDPDDLGVTLSNITNFLVKQSTKNELVLEYIQEILRVYKINSSRHPAKLH